MSVGRYHVDPELGLQAREQFRHSVQQLPVLGDRSVDVQYQVSKMEFNKSGNCDFDHSAASKDTDTDYLLALREMDVQKLPGNHFFFDPFEEAQHLISLSTAQERFANVRGVWDYRIKEESVLKTIRFTFALVALLILFAAFANAQSRFDAYFGMGTARDGSVLDPFGSGVRTSSLDGVFGAFGGEVFLKPNFGVGAQISLRFAQGNYAAGYNYRPIFYDFNGIWTPSLSKRVMPEFQAGFGGANMRVYNPSSPYYNYSTGRYSTYAGSTNHLQLHASAGLRIFVKRHLFVRPQVDYHWVRNLSNPDPNNIPQFNSDSVFAYTVAIGYSSAE